MRIFTAVRHSNDPSQFYGGLWTANFYPALRQLGHDIVESETDLLPASRFMQVAGEYTREEAAVRAGITDAILTELTAAHRRAPIDLFLGYFYNSHFDPAGYDRIRGLGIPSINFYCNSIHQFDLVRDVAKAADWSWHPERDAHRSYVNAGARPVHVQMGADPSVYHPVTVERKRAACFVGQRYADRDELAARLIESNVPLALYGQGWAPADQPKAAVAAAADTYLGRKIHQPATAGSYGSVVTETIRKHGLVDGARRLGARLQQRRARQQVSDVLHSAAAGFVPAGKIAEVFSSYEVCLNFSNVWADSYPGSPLVPHVRLRDFEGPMCRTCYLTGHTDEIREFYEIGREIDTYGSAEELIDKTRFYLDQPDAAERLRDAAYRRASRDHTWTVRFSELFKKIGIAA